MAKTYLKAVRVLIYGTLAVSTACVMNSATGERQLIFMSQDREIEIGREADTNIVSTLGMYEDEQLQRYVSQLGQRMAAYSEQPGLPWDFKVVDDPVVNAFALPGGFIYVTRGILSYFNSEAELAAVLGHEIGHVTARHTAERLSRSQLLGAGLIATMLVTPERFQGLVGVAALGTQVLFLKYGRADERQSDDLGFRYMRRAGYNPAAMPKVFSMLARVSAASGAGRTPEWLSTHPNPENREQRIAARIDSLPPDSLGGVTNRDRFLANLDGVIYGDDPRQGFFEATRFYHPVLRFQLAFPDGWTTQNQRAAVLGVDPEQEGMIQVTITSYDSPENAARDFAAQSGVTGMANRRSRINGLTAWQVDFSLARDASTLRGTATFISFEKRVYRVLGASESQAWDPIRPSVLRATESFSPLSDPEKLNVKPNRIEIVTVTESMSFQTFLQRYPSVVSNEEMELLNGLSTVDMLTAGQTVKRVVAATH